MNHQISLRIQHQGQSISKAMKEQTTNVGFGGTKLFESLESIRAFYYESSNQPENTTPRKKAFQRP